MNIFPFVLTSVLVVVACSGTESPPPNTPAPIHRCRFRDTNMAFDDIEDFANIMCTYCLYTIHHENAMFAWKRMVNWTIHVEQWRNIIVVVDPDDPESPYTMEVEWRDLLRREPDDLILKEFANGTYIDAFLQCCQDSYDCCQRMMAAPEPKPSDTAVRCPMTWDGWDCWLPAEPDTDARQTCPDVAMLALGPVERCLRSDGHKWCYQNGTWNPHTDYVRCSRIAYNTRRSVIHTTMASEAISFVFITAAIVLFLSYRLYHKDRVKMHLHFFLSILLSSAMSILYAVYVTDAHLESNYDNGVLSSPPVCRTFTFLYKATRMINYFWMLIEGLFFHNMVVFAFNKNKSQWWKWIFAGGWIIPNLIMFAYVAVRIREDNDDCWVDLMGDYEWIFLFFPYLCFAINVILFLNLIRVILHKLVLAKHHYAEFARRGMKTALFLMPIFGLQYVVHFIPIDPTETCDPALLFILHIQVMIEGFQGTIVAIILCFLDQDVCHRLAKSIRNGISRTTTMATTNTNATTTTTMANSMQTNQSQSMSFSSQGSGNQPEKLSCNKRY